VKKPKQKTASPKAKASSPAPTTPKVVAEEKRKGTWLPDDEWEALREAKKREKWAKSKSQSPSWSWKHTDAGYTWPERSPMGLPALLEPEVMLGDIEGFWGADVWSELQDPITDTYPAGAGFPWAWPLLGSMLCLGDNDELDHAEDANDAEVDVVLHPPCTDVPSHAADAAVDPAKLPVKSPRPASTVSSTRSSCGSDRGSRFLQRSDVSSVSVRSDDGGSARFATPRSGSWQALSEQSCNSYVSGRSDGPPALQVVDLPPPCPATGDPALRAIRGIPQTREAS
jgi:hypothetical protein